MPNENTSIVGTGYFLAIVVPVVGFVLGIKAATSDDPQAKTHGPYIVLASLVGGLVWAALLL